MKKPFLSLLITEWHLKQSLFVIDNGMAFEETPFFVIDNGTAFETISFLLLLTTSKQILAVCRKETFEEQFW